ncbi:FAD-dependent pyridine nucleotide-disulphide oxidoreductase [Catenulispora acidiphila DSM 44928]|uniref:FAD-dependent pyridine nucleotide-disulphide oxidoreductase n=1 Tax=Catenulispora acidiphila (strain DSM 44928 / JCM 14897 / NBRC 102108 / NRRL B-24433 / ID139908) TaxID=479433 RepID=C7QI64_CATAD|nr:NAD(P)-binding domain-containing protein [Catenulispora acidiphila]ACU73109.1 FAD-dependent pyridine nucleotide-disulphide oxidoreductase [Catenulispora acidiphila DSM 44928]
MTDVVVIGAGQAGLSSAYHLHRAGFAPDTGYVVLDGDRAPGGAWQHRWPSLRMETVNGIFDLPGMAFEPPSPQEQASVAVPRYFAQYEERFQLAVRRPAAVSAVRSGPDDRLLVRTDTASGAQTWAARAVINATGTWNKPFWPYYPGRETFRGRQLHAATYPGPQEFAGKRVVVVGGGITAIQLLAELAEAGATTTWVTRRPPVFREEPFTREYGREVVAMVDRRVRAGLVPQSVVSVTGLPVTEAIREAQRSGVLQRLPMFDRITPEGIAWDAPDATAPADAARIADPIDTASDENTENTASLGAPPRSVAADVILWCTGWRAALDHLTPLHLRAPGGGITMDGTRVVLEPRLHLVGYGPSASTVGANRAGREAVRDIRRLLAQPAPAGLAA